MADRNAKLAKENNSLKASLTSSLKEQEEMLKKSIKAGYFSSVSYNDAIGTIDESIRCIELCLDSCKQVRERVEENYRRLEGGALREKNTDSRKAKIKADCRMTDNVNEAHANECATKENDSDGHVVAADCSTKNKGSTRKAKTERLKTLKRYKSK